MATDGQTENKNAWIISALRDVVNWKQTDWDENLDIVEFGINDTSKTPFDARRTVNNTTQINVAFRHPFVSVTSFSSMRTT
ncbi:hypothetical protein HK405_012259 [Cladochytrium tenue]|nr:hypothetical protein HK405_012259 [Cladochytrium tenue]